MAPGKHLPEAAISPLSARVAADTRERAAALWSRAVYSPTREGPHRPGRGNGDPADANWGWKGHRPRPGAWSCHLSLQPAAGLVLPEGVPGIPVHSARVVFETDVRGDALLFRTVWERGCPHTALAPELQNLSGAGCQTPSLVVKATALALLELSLSPGCCQPPASGSSGTMCPL